MRAALGEDEAAVQEPEEGRAAVCELAQHRPVDDVQDRVHVGCVGHGAVRAHPAGVRPCVAVPDALEVAGRGERDRVFPRSHREDRELRPLEQLFGVEGLAERLRGEKRRVERRLVAAHPDTFAGGEAVRLDDTRGLRHGERRCGGDARRLQHVLCECLRTLDPGCGRARPEDVDAAMTERIGQPGHEGRLGPDDDEVDAELCSEWDDRGCIFGADRVAARERGDTGIAWRCMQLGPVARERPDERVLATARSDHEHLHRAMVTRVCGSPVLRRRHAWSPGSTGTSGKAR